MNRSAVSMDAAASPGLSRRARWLAGGVIATLVLVAAALWARYGAAVFVDALGAVVSCF